MMTWLRKVPGWLWLALATVLSLGYAWHARRTLAVERAQRREERLAIDRTIAEAGDRHAAELAAVRAHADAEAAEAARLAAADARHDAEQARVDADAAMLKDAIAVGEVADEVNRRLDAGVL